MDLFHIFIDKDWGVSLSIGPWLWGSLLTLAIVYWIYRIVRHGNALTDSFEIDEMQLGIGDQKINLKPNYEDLQVAYRMWVELKTRKIGLPIDEKHDVIAEIYASWYEFFKIARELIKSVPVRKLRENESTQTLVALSLRVLNDGLRPHLTQWQARYRSWAAHASQQEPDKALTPQELQQKYPQYRELLADMREVNKRLVYYTGLLERMVYGQKHAS